MHSDRLRVARAAFVFECLVEERWSIRKASMAIGINPTSLGDRLKGDVAFTAEDIEAIARLLKRDPVEFYRDYLNAENAPTPEGGGVNEQPSDYKATISELAEARERLRPRPVVDRRTLATVTPIREAL